MDPIMLILVLLAVAKIALLVGVLVLAYRVYRRHLVDGMAPACRRAVLTIAVTEGVGLIILLDGSFLFTSAPSSILAFLLPIPVAAAAILMTSLLFGVIVAVSSLWLPGQAQGSR